MIGLNISIKRGLINTKSHSSLISSISFFCCFARKYNLRRDKSEQSQNRTLYNLIHKKLGIGSKEQNPKNTSYTLDKVNQFIVP